ncbi:hypothetical protein HDE69_000404 [Pedobacter cryoconitis]|uniref:Uncharacterized protein n=1 Tax=Pedobacter cryoconitis TaxID=188932 RepID=A0A7W8YPD1_9SPHI|nr:hypothetical protein [Pedobacter cryoconitis]MBB5619368.1 hypothetical protein [Pedobacter cryoconitis]MBB5644656.1 hypothetical protein [Pedobacter cryoconitis]
MGQFASIISLTRKEILTLTETHITDIPTAIKDLNLITTSLTPRRKVSAPPPFPDSDLSDSLLSKAIGKAINSAYLESRYLFKAIFPSVDLPLENNDFGVVLNYGPVMGDFKSLTNQLSLFLTNSNLQPLLAGELARQLQPQVMASGNTPSATFGRVATPNLAIVDPLITVEYLFWVASFGIFRTEEINPSGESNYAVVYSCSAANGTLQSIMK